MYIIHAIFIQEDKTRFKCKVLYKNNIIDCYVPCSCKLSKLLRLKAGMDVLLTQNKNSKKLFYSMCAIKIADKYVIINPTFANYAFKRYLEEKSIEYSSEYLFNNYRSDFFIHKSKEIIEIKSVLSDRDIVLFPQIQSDRFLSQMQTLEKLLDDGYKCKLILMILNPNIKKIYLNYDMKICPQIINCIKKGLVLLCYNCILDSKREPFLYESSVSLII